MIAFLILLFIALFVGSFIVKYFAHAVPFLGAIATPLIIICVIEGLIMAVFVGIRIYNEWKGKR